MTGAEILFAVVFSVAFAVGYPLVDKLFSRNKENIDQEWLELERLLALVIQRLLRHQLPRLRAARAGIARAALDRAAW